MATIIIVEDEPLLGQSFEASLADDGHEVHWLRSAEEATAWLEDRQVDLALVDVGLPGIDGLEFLKELTTTHPGTSVIVMTAHGNIQMAVEAMKLGASDFLIKPVDLEAISMLSNKSLRNRRLIQTWNHEQKYRAQRFGLHQIIGRCPEIEKAKAVVRRLTNLRVAASESPPNILITGETGTGKDLLARAFHYEGPRNESPFVQINCAALPDTLVESELFGHTKGAFTDARSSKRGLFDVADQGTLFLDEVNSLSLPMQAKLLTAIESGRIRPVGSVQDKTVNIQIIAAMNEDPQEKVRQGGLREDLYHRLRVVHVDLPPLRQRGDDLLFLAEHFLQIHCEKFGMKPKRFSPSARRLLSRYRWPGNVRELHHRLESAVLLSDELIEADALPQPKAGLNEVNGRSVVGTIPADFSTGPVPLAEVERELLTRAMAAADENVSRAAELLAVSRDTMRYRLDKHDLPHKQNGGRE